MLLTSRMYVLTRAPLPVPGGCRSRAMYGLQLITGSSIPVHPLVDGAGRDVGWLVGWAVSPAGLVSRSYTVDTADPEPDLYRLGGAWLAILPQAARVYLDPTGCLGAVYSPSLGRLAPTSAWMSEAEVDTDLAEALNIPAEERAFYPFGLAPRQGCRRLLPNHYLALDEWRAVRHWPAERFPDVGPREAVRIIGDLTADMIRSLVPPSPYLGITAGRDTRAILACARGVVADLECFTMAIPDRQGRRDVDIAQRLARVARLKHRVLPFLPPDHDELSAWQQRADHSVGGRTWRNVRTMQQIDPSRPCLTGAAGEVARAYYWQPSDDDHTELRAGNLLERLHLPETRVLATAAQSWLDGLPAVDTYQTLDLLYLEIRAGCWNAPQGAAHSDSPPRITPLSHRTTVAAMMGLPAAYKRSSRLAMDLVYARWPELASLPFNQAVGWRYFARTARSLKKRIARLIR